MGEKGGRELYVQKGDGEEKIADASYFLLKKRRRRSA